METEENQTGVKKGHREFKGKVKYAVAKGHQSYLLTTDNVLYMNHLRTIQKHCFKTNIKLISSGKGFIVILSEAGLV